MTATPTTHDTQPFGTFENVVVRDHAAIRRAHSHTVIVLQMGTRKTFISTIIYIPFIYRCERKKYFFCQLAILLLSIIHIPFIHYLYSFCLLFGLRADARQLCCCNIP